MLLIIVLVSLCLTVSSCSSAVQKRKGDDNIESPLAKRQHTEVELPEGPLGASINYGPESTLFGSCTPLELDKEDEVVEQISEYAVVSGQAFTRVLHSILQILQANRPQFFDYFSSYNTSIPSEELIACLELIEPNEERGDAYGRIDPECTEVELAGAIIYEFLKAISEGPLATDGLLMPGHFMAYFLALIKHFM